MPELLGDRPRAWPVRAAYRLAEVSELLRQVADRPGSACLRRVSTPRALAPAMQHAKVQRIISELLDDAGTWSSRCSRSARTPTPSPWPSSPRRRSWSSRPSDPGRRTSRPACGGSACWGRACSGPPSSLARRLPARARPRAQPRARRRPGQVGLSAIKRYDDAPDQVPGQQAPIWTAATPKVSGSQQRTTRRPRHPRSPKETWPMPRVAATERDGFPNPADPATGD